MVEKQDDIFRGPLISEAMAQGYTTGFDYLRIVLSVAVLAWHAVTIAYGPAAARVIFDGPARGLISLILPMFFALSGFLVAGSLMRTSSLVQFGTLRAIRLLPALIVEVVLSAFILGPLLTKLPLWQYFTDINFFNYLGNVVGRIRLRLPGVFDDAIGGTNVNASLWTVPFELECYILLGLLAAFGVARRPKLFLACAVAANILLLALSLWSGTDPVDRPPGRMLVACFIFGVSIFLFRDRIRLSFGVFVIALIGALAALSFSQTAYVAPVFASYVTVYLGLLNPPKLDFLKRHDLSYGIYLYAFPIQQTVAFCLPSYNTWAFNVAVSLPLTVLFAFTSWNVVEAPFMSRKKHITALVERTFRIVWRPRAAEVQG